MNQKIRCIIADDEPIAREGLVRYAERIDYLDIIAECEDVMELDRLLNTGLKPDLIFLDIEMPMISGLDYLSRLSNPPLTIITTAYPQHALRGFDLNVLDYLLKPIPFPRFMQAATKARDAIVRRESHDDKDFIFIRSDRTYHKIHPSEIIYLEALENYVRIVTEKRKLIARSPFKEFLKSFPSSDFIQIHKSYAVNMEKVSTVEGNLIHLPDITLQVSRGFKDRLTEYLSDHSSLSDNG